MISDGYRKLSARLDDIINFENPDDKRFPVKTAAVAGAGVAGAGAATYGLYKRGQAAGEFTFPFSKGPRSKGGVISTPASRGVVGNIAVGASHIPGDVRGIVDKGLTRASILSSPEARNAAAHDIRAGIAKKLGRWSRKIKP